MRIRREENEKRLGMATTSIAGLIDRKSEQRLGTESQDALGGEVGYAEIASVGWGRVKKKISGAVQW